MGSGKVRSEKRTGHAVYIPTISGAETMFLTLRTIAPDDEEQKNILRGVCVQLVRGYARSRICFWWPVGDVVEFDLVSPSLL